MSVEKDLIRVHIPYHYKMCSYYYKNVFNVMTFTFDPYNLQGILCKHYRRIFSSLELVGLVFFLQYYIQSAILVMLVFLAFSKLSLY